MLNRLKSIKECIDLLKNNYYSLPIEDPDRNWYQQAIDDLDSYLIDEQDVLEEQYSEHYMDKYSESKYSF